MFNRIEKTLALRALVLAGLVVGSVSSAVLAAAPAHMGAKNVQLSARLNGAYGFVTGGVQNSTAVYSRGRYLGQDPDPSIRAQLLRDGWFGNR